MNILFKKRLKVLERDNSPERSGVKINVDGLQTENFKANPVVTIHGDNQRPHGRAEVEIDDEGLWARIMLSPNLIGQEVHDKLQAGLLSGDLVLTLGVHVLEHTEEDGYRRIDKADLVFLMIIPKAMKEGEMDEKKPPVERTEKERPETRKEQKDVGRHNRGILDAPSRVQDEEGQE